MNNKAEILYVEDDETLGFITKDNLEINGYQVDLYKNGKEAIQAYKNKEYDLCILDVMLPEVDGYQVAKSIRARNSQVPIIFLSAKSLKEDRIHGLELGGDDYITKPFSIEELMLKIDIFLKRKFISVKVNSVNSTIGEYKLEFDQLQLIHPKESRQLTQKEAELLRFLIDHKNQIVKRNIILERVWGDNDYFMGRSMDVFISRLRKYLKNDESIRLENVHGVGFRLMEG